MINISTRESSIRTVKSGDNNWMLSDGFIIAPRAGIMISEKCPQSHVMVLQQCIDRGWIKPIAHVYDHELMWEKLNEAS